MLFTKVIMVFIKPDPTCPTEQSQALKHFLNAAWADFNRKYSTMYPGVPGWYQKGVKSGIHQFRLLLDQSDSGNAEFLDALKLLTEDDFAWVLNEGTERSIKTLLEIKDYLVRCLEQSSQPRYEQFKEIHRIL